jgi:hypothetical protein
MVCPVDTSTPLPPSTPTPINTLRSTSTPTDTPLLGAIITAFGIADAASGTFNTPVDTDAEGRSIFQKQNGSDFIVFIEGRPGPLQFRVGTILLNTRAGDPVNQPDLQVISSRNLGNGSPAVCDQSLPSPGGVPGIDPPDFSAVQAVSDALNDLACRFKTFSQADFPCTQDTGGNFVLANPSSTIQFCMLVNEALAFSAGDTVLTARMRDTAGQTGPSAQIVVRINGTQ